MWGHLRESLSPDVVSLPHMIVHAYCFCLERSGAGLTVCKQWGWGWSPRCALRFIRIIKSFASLKTTLKREQTVHTVTKKFSQDKNNSAVKILAGNPELPGVLGGLARCLLVAVPGVTLIKIPRLHMLPECPEKGLNLQRLLGFFVCFCFKLINIYTHTHKHTKVELLSYR